MKSWLFLISFGFVLQIRAQISVYDCGAISQIVTQSEIEAADNEYYKQCIMFIPPETYDFNGNLNRKVTAATNIHLKEGVHIGPFTQDGQFWMQINPTSDFDVAVMNYENLNNVLKFEKMELGITLPQDVFTKVNNFVTDASVPEEDKLNPYLDWELRVYAEFTPAVAEWPFIIDGFYTKEFDVEMPEVLPVPIANDYYEDEEYMEIGKWLEQPNDYPFRIRFAPNQTGLWSGKIKIEINDELIYTSSPFNFNVIESGNVGYVKVGINKRYLRREGTFFPIGCNLKWPETTKSNDPELWEYLVEEWEMPERYRHVYAMPRVYDKFREMMTQLSNGGGNYFRWIMFPPSTEMEWEKLGDYTKRLHMAQEMDDIVDHAKELDMFIHWNMQIHYSLQFSENAYGNKWTWDFFTNNADYCYKVLVNSDNPMDFFTNETAKQYYKQRLRYILARWVYSTNVAVWELFSEISNVGASEADNSDYYMQGNNWMIYRDWQVEMAEYLKSMYHGQCHLVTASYGGEKHPDDDTFESPHMDIMTSNIYDYGPQDFNLFYINKINATILNDNVPLSYTSQTIKPLILSETDPINLPCDDSKIEIRRSIYQSAFSGLAGALSWDLQLHPQYFATFSPLKQFISNIDFDFNGWHPGTSYVNDQGKWMFKNDYAKFMDGVVDLGEGNIRNKRADLAYLRSEDSVFCIGILTNKTYNSVSINDCLVEGWDQNFLDNLDAAETVDTKDEDLFFSQLSGGKMQKYYIDYYLTSDVSNPILTSSFRKRKAQVKIPLSYDGSNYQLFFVVRRKNHNLSPQQIEFLQWDETPNVKVSLLQIEDETTISPNPVTERDLNLIISSSRNIENLKIYNVLGQLVLEDKMYSNQLNVEFLSNGVYIVKIHYSDGYITSHSLSIQK